MSKIKQKQFPVWLFGLVFLIILGVVILSRVMSPAQAQINVPDFAGVGDMLTQGPNLIAVFQDGKVAAWDWTNPSPAPSLQFSASSDRFVVLDDTRAAAVSKTGRKLFTVYDLKTGNKISETPVGWEDQDIWLLQSPDKKHLALACVNPDKDGHTLYEFMAIDPAKGKPDMPVSVDIPTAQKRFITFALSNDKKVLAAGSAAKHGCLRLIDLDKEKEILKKEYDKNQEFTSAAFTPDSLRAFLTNRDGSIYGIDIVSGEIKSTYTVLEPGQKNPVTNETSSQNIVISNDGKLVAAVVINVVHIWDIQTGNPVFQQAPGHMLTGPIAFSPDNSLLASSDLRAGRVIRIWKIKK
jgi:WD40 repeat protein